MKFPTISLTLAQLLNTAAKFGLFVVLAQVGGPATAGEYALALAVTTPTFLLFGLSLRSIYVTSHVDVNYHQFLSLRIIYGVMGVTVVGLLAAIVYPQQTNLFLGMAAYRFSELLVDMRLAYFQNLSRLGQMSLGVASFAVVTTGCVTLVYVTTHDLTISLTAAAASGLVVYFALGILSRQREPTLAHKWSWPTVLSVSRNGFMLSLSSFAVALGTSVPVFFLEAYHGTAALGIYSAIYNLTTVANILYSSVSQAELKTFSRLVLKRDFATLLGRGRRISIMLAGVGTLGAFVIVIWGQEILEVVFGQDFSTERLALVAMGAIIILSPFGFLLDVQLTALHRFPTQGVLSVLSLGVSVLLGFLLVPGLGILGATLVVLSVLVLRTVVKYVLVARGVRALAAGTTGQDTKSHEDDSGE